MNKAEALELTNPTAANVLWGQIDQQMMSTGAPWVPLFNPKQIDFVSKRVGNYQFSRQFYMYVDQLWVK
jgi:peptide/nickel transport system substrate-binding protein